jgi:hypothetical protein
MYGCRWNGPNTGSYTAGRFEKMPYIHYFPEMNYHIPVHIHKNLMII